MIMKMKRRTNHYAANEENRFGNENHNNKVVREI